jgi:hypothetical protein
MGPGSEATDVNMIAMLEPGAAVRRAFKFLGASDKCDGDAPLGICVGVIASP